MRFTTNIQIICKLRPIIHKPQVIMKNYFFLLFLGLTLNSCYDDNYVDNNFIPNVVFNTTINLNLPQYLDLQTPSLFVVDPNLGQRGIIIYNTGSGEQSVDEFLAFDLACPHIELHTCANPMDISKFPEMTNSCTTDGIFYRFDLGYSITYSKDEDGNMIPVEGPVYDLQQYKVDRISSQELRISNY